jgi:hypothetical protein
LHFRSLERTKVPFQVHFLATKAVYGQYGIRVDFASGKSLGLSRKQAQRYSRVDGSCEWMITDGEYLEVQRLGPKVPANDIVVYYVNRFSNKNLHGCGGHLPDRPACIVASAAGAWTTAHEVGHVLLTSKFRRVHEPDIKNLMYPYDIRAKWRSLNPPQLMQILQSPCCQKI